MAERSKLSALLTGVMSAVQKAATTAGQQNLYILDHYFVKQADGRLTPRYARIEVAPGQVMDVPLLSLINPAGYQLEELSMALSLKMNLEEIKKATHESLDHEVKKGSYSVELCPKTPETGHRRSDVAEVTVKFKACSAAEGLMRIIEDLNTTIGVQRLPPAEPVVDRVDLTAETEFDDPIVIEENDADTDA